MLKQFSPRFPSVGALEFPCVSVPLQLLGIEALMQIRVPALLPGQHLTAQLVAAAISWRGAG
jgi:hypothetical protein